jgi:hypothetical protein
MRDLFACEIGYLWSARCAPPPLRAATGQRAHTHTRPLSHTHTHSFTHTHTPILPLYTTPGDLAGRRQPPAVGTGAAHGRGASGLEPWRRRVVAHDRCRTLGGRLLQGVALELVHVYILFFFSRIWLQLAYGAVIWIGHIAMARMQMGIQLACS